MADLVVERLGALGVTVHEDGTGKVIRGDCGNLWCVVGGLDAEPRLALGAHLDTVSLPPTIDPVLDRDVIGLPDLFYTYPP